MLDKLSAINDRHKEVEELISSPDAMNDMKLYVQLSKEYKDLEPIVKAYKEYRDLVGNIVEAKEILSNSNDAEMKEIAKIDLDKNLPRKEEMDEEIKVLLIPKDPADAKNAVMEIRAGTGGDEASIFAGDLYRMYTAFASTKGWKTELVDVADGTAGGYKEIIFNITGEDVYGQLKFESGVHRVQRVPQTETQGRVHTSALCIKDINNDQIPDMILGNYCGGLSYFNGDTLTTNIQENYASNNLLIYPNPTNGDIFVQSKIMGILNIYNVLGQLLISEEKNIRNYKVNTNRLPKGVYIIKLERAVSKFVKE